MSHLNFELKNHFRLIAGDRWNVLTILLLHANIRNRCWVGMDRIAFLATNGNLAHATKAKKWLIQHGAAELVPYSKRVGKERELPARQHVYQLTGEFTTCNDLDCCKEAEITVQYLYFQTPNVFDGENINVSDGENFNGENLSSTSTRKTSKKKPKDSAPQNGAGSDSPPSVPHKAKAPNPLFDLIAKFSFGISAGGKVNGGRVGKIVAYLRREGATVEAVQHFYDWYADAYPGMNAPRDLDKFIEHWAACPPAETVRPESIPDSPPRPPGGGWTPPVDDDFLRDAFVMSKTGKYLGRRGELLKNKPAGMLDADYIDQLIHSTIEEIKT